MPLQLVYTSANVALKPGVTGFATVAQHPGIRAALARAIEQRSGYLDAYALGGRRPPVFAHRCIETGGQRAHVLTRVVDSGTDYSGRNNHLAHHFVFSEDEVRRLRITPAELLWRLPWLNAWEGEPRYFSGDDELDCSSWKPEVRLPAAQWRAVTGHAGCAALPYETEGGDARVFFAVDEQLQPEILLRLFAESLLLKDPHSKSPGSTWRIPFCTIEASGDDAADFQWLGVPVGSPRHAGLMKQKRYVISFGPQQAPTGLLVEVAENPAKAETMPVINEIPTAREVARPAAVPERSPSRKNKAQDDVLPLSSEPVGGEGARNIRILALLAGAAVVLIGGGVGWWQMQRTCEAEARQAENDRLATARNELAVLEQAFQRGADVTDKINGLPARFGDSWGADAALEQKRRQLLAIGADRRKKVEGWLARLEPLSDRVLGIQLVPEDELLEMDTQLSKLGVSGELARGLEQQLDDLRLEAGLVRPFAEALGSKSKGDAELRDKLESAMRRADQSKSIRPEVKKGLHAAFATIFPPAVVAKAVAPSVKVVEAAKPKVVEAALPKQIDAGLSPALRVLVRLKRTYITLQSGVASGKEPGIIDFSAVPDLVSDAGKFMQKEGGVRVTSLVRLDHPAGPPTAFQLLDGKIYDAKTRPVLAFVEKSLRRADDWQPWQFGDRAMFAFGQGEEEPTFRLVAVNLRASPDPSAMEPLLRLPASELLTRDPASPSRVVIAPDKRKLLKELKRGESGADTVAWRLIPAFTKTLNNSDGTEPRLPPKEAPTTLDSLWDDVFLDLASLAGGPDPVSGQELTEQIAGLKPIADARNALFNGLPNEKGGFAAPVLAVQRDNSGALITNANGGPLLGEPKANTIPDTTLRTLFATQGQRCPGSAFAEMLMKALRKLDDTKLLFHAAADEAYWKEFDVLRSVTNWNEEHWQRFLVAWDAFINSEGPTEEDRQKNRLNLQGPEFQQCWDNRRRMRVYAFNTIPRKLLEAGKDYFLWLPMVNGDDPEAHLTEARSRLARWKHDTEVAARFAREQPGRLGGYALYLTFTRAAGIPPLTVKWVEFEEEMTAPPAAPQAAPSATPAPVSGAAPPSTDEEAPSPKKRKRDRKGDKPDSEVDR